MAEQKLYNAIDIKRSLRPCSFDGIFDGVFDGIKKFDARAKPIVLTTVIKNVAK